MLEGSFRLHCHHECLIITVNCNDIFCGYKLNVYNNLGFLSLQVKNIEFLERENVMVTSAFDGSIYAWDLKSPTENSMLYDKVLLMNGLMRTKLTPDGSKMVISTTGGYIVIVHDLNLATLANDFRSFKVAGAFFQFDNNSSDCSHFCTD